MAPPNIVYIHSHDTGRYIQPYGFAVETPHLQRFAEEGVLFRHAFCAAPTCSPSRAALLTGQYPHQNGMIALAHNGGQLVDPTRHLAHYLRSQGYATALSGVQHVTHGTIEANQAVGYDRYLTRERWPAWSNCFERWNAWYAEAACQYLLNREENGPFFLDCGFDLTHRMGKGEQWHTTVAPPAGDARYVRPPLPLPDTPETRRDFADFRVAVNLLDTYVGEVLQTLERAGVTENTLVIITTDHGVAYPQMKCNLTTHGTGVLLMLRGPGGFRGGQVVDSLVSHVDLFPTICEVAGLSTPKGLEGVSLVPLTRGASAVRETVFAEVNWHAAPEPMRAVRTDRYAYIRRFTPCTHPVLPNCDDSVSKTLLRAAGWDAHPQAAEELYDLVFDPNEACNRADDPAYAEILAGMRTRLRDWMMETRDPLLAGRLDHWPTGQGNRVDEDSPQCEKSPAEPIILDEAAMAWFQRLETP